MIYNFAIWKESKSSFMKFKTKDGKIFMHRIPSNIFQRIVRQNIIAWNWNLLKKNPVGSVIYWPNKLNIKLFVCRTPSIIFQEIIVLLRNIEEEGLETKKRNVIWWNSYFRLKIILLRTLINIIKNDQIKLIVKS